MFFLQEVWGWERVEEKPRTVICFRSQWRQTVHLKSSGPFSVRTVYPKGHVLPGVCAALNAWQSAMALPLRLSDFKACLPLAQHHATAHVKCSHPYSVSSVCPFGKDAPKETLLLLFPEAVPAHVFKSFLGRMRNVPNLKGLGEAVAFCFIHQQKPCKLPLGSTNVPECTQSVCLCLKTKQNKPR